MIQEVYDHGPIYPYLVQVEDFKHFWGVVQQKNILFKKVTNDNQVFHAWIYLQWDQCTRDNSEASNNSSKNEFYTF